jgi:hypothetical protein
MDIMSEISDDININQTPNIEWTPEHEAILIEWADKAMCYRWLHSKANNMYGTLNAWYTIPVIVISTLTGTANFAQERVPLQYQNYFSMFIGTFNILAGIITTIQQFLKITQLNESHRVSSIAWDKFYRNIKIELAKHPSERIEPKQMLKMSKEEFDRLIETSPTIPDKIVNQFKIKFIQQEAFDKIIKPEICDILVPTTDYKNPWYNEENQSKNINEAIKTQLNRQNKIKKQNELNKKIVNDFITLFINLNNREPMESEIIDNLKERIDIITIRKIIDDNKNYINNINVKSNHDDDVSDKV